MAEQETINAVLNKGLNLIAAEDAIPDGASPDAGNVELGVGGRWKSRGGSSKASYVLPTPAGATLETFVMEEEGYPAPNVAQLLCTGGQIYRTVNDASGSQTVTDIGSYATPSGATVGYRPYGVAFLDSSALFNSVLVFGSDNPQAVLPTTDDTILTSPAGTTWTARTASSSYTVHGSAYGASLYVVVGAAGSIATSPDGTTWTSRTSGTSQTLYSVVWTGSQFIAVGANGVILTSTNGTTWTSRTSGVTSILFGVEWSGSVACAVGAGGVILTSTDGITWTSQTSGVSTDLFTVVQDGSKLIVGGAGGVVLTSPAGVTWTSQTSGVTADLNGSAYDGSKTVLVGAAGTIITTTNGSSWTIRTSGVTVALYEAEWNGSTFVAVGSEGTILTSTNGTSWTTATSGVANTMYAVVWGALFVVGGSQRTVAVTNPDWTTSNGYPITCASYQGRMWYAGSKQYPARIWVTEQGSVSSFATHSPAVATDSFTLDLNLTTGGKIIGIKHLYDIMLVFTTRGVYRVVATTGTVPYSASFVSNLVAVSQHAIVQVENAIYFMTRGGVFLAETALTYGDIQANGISIAISPLFPKTEEWRLSGAFAAYDANRRKVYFFVDHQHTFARSSSQASAMTQSAAVALINAALPAYPPYVTECFAFDLRSKEWERSYWDFPIHYAVNRDDGTGTVTTEAYSRGSTTAMSEYELFIDSATDDAGSAFTSYARTKKHIMKTMMRRKARLFAYPRIVSGSPTVNSSVDGAAFVATIGGTVSTGINRRTVVGSGKDLQLEYVSTAQFEADSYSIDSNVKGRR